MGSQQGFTPAHLSQVSPLHIPPIMGKNKLPSSRSNRLSFHHINRFVYIILEFSSFVFEQVSREDLGNSLMYENQVACWIEKQRESSYTVCSSMFSN